MKILFAWELGSSQETLWCMGRLARALKAVIPDCKIAVACVNPINRADVPWATKVYASSKLAFRHEKNSQGVAHQLHHLGWTTHELRAMHLQTWSAAFEKIKPDLTFAFEAPSAVIAGTLLGNRILLATARLRDDYSHLENDFPELTDWVKELCGHSLETILNRPGISFLSSFIDTGRSSLVLNVSLFDKGEQLDSPKALILANGVFDQSQVVLRLSEQGITPILIGNASKLLDCSFTDSNAVGLVVGPYDTLSTTYALNRGIPYLGTPGTDPQSQAIAGLMEGSKRGYRLGSDGLMLDVLLASLTSFNAQAREQNALDGGGVCSVESACEFFVGKKNPL
ncbi:hypothetical protein IFT48_00160 [Pseudomonas fluorescens]|uniref:hypothetical protein n=1 Tax=Pseudomonas TaxID=286 RepID=UPI000F02A0A9|nr:MULTISPECIES: hypothetical protein [Pseudomonas]MBD8088405.1 hypothetical protein [Pseudomonas fluorescens]MBD8681176.1 hypothetical protein [Pseudomonas sp. CFBP 13719]